MATTRTCDYCKQAKDDVSEIRGEVSIVGAVYPGQPTGASLAGDSCVDCRAKALADLSVKAAKQLERDLPELRLMKEEDDRLAEKRVAASQLTPDTPKAKTAWDKIAADERAIRDRRTGVAKARAG